MAQHPSTDILSVSSTALESGCFQIWSQDGKLFSRHHKKKKKKKKIIQQLEVRQDKQTLVRQVYGRKIIHIIFI